MSHLIQQQKMPFTYSSIFLHLSGVLSFPDTDFLVNFIAHY